MKKLRKSLFAIILGICCMLSVSFATRAAEKEEVLFHLREAQDIVVTIAYGVNDISFTLVSPSGFEITKETDTETVTVLSGTTSTLVFIGQAEAGEWKIRYDKGSNESISVSANVQDNSFFITDYQVGSPDGTKLPVQFTVSAQKEFNYQYKLMLTTSAETLNGKELLSGRGVTGKAVTKEISLENISTYDSYYLLLYVYYDLNGSEIFDYNYSEAFAYTNAQAPQALENIDVMVDHDAKTVDLNWKAYVNNQVTNVFVSAYAGDDCIWTNEYPTQQGYTATISYEAEGIIRFEVSYRNRNGVVSEMLQKEVDVTPHLSLPQTGKVNSDIWTFSYDKMSETEVVFAFEKDKYTVVLDGEGTKYLLLPESRNQITVTYTDADGNVHTYERIANISDEKPMIELLRKVDGVTTVESVIMVTGTTNAESISVNGKEIEIKDGEFAYAYQLSDGQNEIVLEAVLGENETTLVAVVTKKASWWHVQWQYLGAGLIVSLIGIIFVLSAGRKRNKKEEAVFEKPEGRKKTSLALNWVLSGVFAALWLGLIWFTNSMGYLKVAYESLLLAKCILLARYGAFCIAVILVVVALIRILVRKMVKKLAEIKLKRQQKKEQKKQGEKNEETK